jgi:hypothetical protein
MLLFDGLKLVILLIIWADNKWPVAFSDVFLLQRKWLCL